MFGVFNIDFNKGISGVISLESRPDLGVLGGVLFNMILDFLRMTVNESNYLLEVVGVFFSSKVPSNSLSTSFKSILFSSMAFCNTNQRNNYE